MDDLFQLNEDELTLAQSKNGSRNKLGFAILLKNFQLEYHYPKHNKYINPIMLNVLANQLDIRPSVIDDYDWEGRTTERYRKQIREFLGYKKAKDADISLFKQWLMHQVFPIVTKKLEFVEHAYNYFHELRIEPLTFTQLEYHINSAFNQFESKLFSEVEQQLSLSTKEAMDATLVTTSSNDVLGSNISLPKITDVKFRHLKKDVPGVKLKHVAFEVEKMKTFAKMQLPIDHLNTLPKKIIKKYYQRIMAEPPSSIQQHTSIIKYASFAIFCYHRSQITIDNAIDLFVQLTHRLKTKAEQEIIKKAVSDVKRVDGKFDILYQLANIALNHPDGVIQDKIYSEVSEDTLKAVVQELEHKGKWYDYRVNNKIRSLYSHASRKPLLTLLDTFELKTNLKQSKKVLEALNVIKNHRNFRGKYFPKSSEIPVENVIHNSWYHLVVENSSENSSDLKINRMSYEIAVLQELCKQINCKMIWVEGAYRYQNPDRELPQDFDENREYYYSLLGLPINAKEFIEPRKHNLHNQLMKLNADITNNKKVSITKKKGGRIKVSPSEPQAEPPNIKKLHRSIHKAWGIINLIDILKETDLQIGFTQQLQSVASREQLTKKDLQKRLLLCLYAIGTNTGLKAISAANGNVSYSDLRYVKRRFIIPEQVKAAIVDIINQILAIRDPRVWGEATTGVACDSKKLSVWDQNLMVEWHTRYRGRGVMIYWHVDKQSLCIHSQLKTCSSSEVGSMFKGILQHCTDMFIDKAYMDTHGQSTLGFGVGELLNFSLLPRLKSIDEQKLYYPSHKQKSEYDNLQDILQDVINWELIEENYDEAVKHIAALKLGMVEPETFIKRFSKDNYQHPIYKTLVEIGKIAKTVFLCDYLVSEELRIEIHEAQNIVERVNSIMSFIFYGKLGEISTNIKIEQELSILSLHLLQACMAYVNTLLIQAELSKPEWDGVLTHEDKRALNVLMHFYINPYGLFPLDLSERLGITETTLPQKVTLTAKKDRQINHKPKSSIKV